MSSDIAIRVEGVGKLYSIFDNSHSRLFQMLLMGRKKLYREFWALRDVSFTVGRGETVGIVGRNGSGKSTLLQLVSGTLSATTGAISISGPIAALLELGTGFNPEFTGRENVYVNGALLGMAREEIEHAFPAIAEFAAIGDFVDQPVKTYSSGMLVRLAIAVAFHSKPSILIIDEALAVGDASFQRKCMRRISELVESGVTLLFVSHDSETVKSICERAIYLESGRVKAIGPAKEVCTQYERDLFGGEPIPESGNTRPSAFVDDALVATSEQQYGDGACTIEMIELLDGKGSPANVFAPGAPLSVSYMVRANQDLYRPVFGMMITDKNGSCIFGVNTSTTPHMKMDLDRGSVIPVKFDLENNLGPGTYYLTCGVHSGGGTDGLVYHHRRLDTKILRSLSPEDQLCGGFAQMNARIQLGSASNG